MALDLLPSLPGFPWAYHLPPSTIVVKTDPITYSDNKFCPITYQELLLFSPQITFKQVEGQRSNKQVIDKCNTLGNGCKRDLEAELAEKLSSNQRPSKHNLTNQVGGQLKCKHLCLLYSLAASSNTQNQISCQFRGPMGH